MLCPPSDISCYALPGSQNYTIITHRKLYSVCMLLFLSQIEMKKMGFPFEPNLNTVILNSVATSSSCSSKGLGVRTENIIGF